MESASAIRRATVSSSMGGGAYDGVEEMEEVEEVTGEYGNSSYSSSPYATGEFVYAAYDVLCGPSYTGCGAS
jgi:hypothetical protein